MAEPAVPGPEAFAPHETALETWSLGHLFRRTAFGSTAERLGRFEGKAVGEVLDWLLEYDPAQDPLNERLEEMLGLVSLNRPEVVQEWWLFRMLMSPRPLQERLALFWHNHFATSMSKVGTSELMHQQVELFRRQGMGSFRELLVAVGRDPAMLIWLDGRYSKKGKPNENYAREVMELFSLGRGHYTENDVRELSRAFTGWTVRNLEAHHDPKQFDDGEKDVLGKKGKFDSASAVDLLLEHPAAPKFIARKLLVEFVHPQPTDSMVDHYAKRLLEHKWVVKPVLREMLSSKLFFSDWAYRSRIKSPVEFVVGSALAMGGRPNTMFLREQSGKMGQTLLYPPTVEGWKGQENWINANTVLQRFNYGMWITSQRDREFARREDLDAWLAKHKVKDAEGVVDHYAQVLLDGRLPEAAKAKLLDYMNRDQKGAAKKFEMKPEWVSWKVRGVVHLMMSVPEYQLA